MPRSRYRSSSLLLLLAVAVTATGCAHRVQTAAATEPIVKSAAEEQQLLASYERTRSEAQLEAARVQVELGNLAVAEESLTALLARQADHREAGLLMAEILTSTARLPAALAVLDRLILARPTDAAAHHLRGMVLHDLDRPAEARASLTKALELAPENETYRLSHDTLAEI
jgi:predicted negative regulator of RcsB-dependent stress response